MATKKLTPSERLDVRAFNEWMRQYTLHPECFNREFQDVEQFKADEALGEEPDYGFRCVLTMKHIRAEIARKDKRRRSRK